MSYNLNGSDALKLFTVFRKDDLGICISWIIDWFEEVVSSFWNLDPLAEPIFRLRRRFPQSKFSTICSLKSPGTCKYFATFIALKLVLILFTLRATFFAPILAEIKEINFKYGQASRQRKLSITKCRSPYTEPQVVNPMSELLLFVYSKSHVTLHVKSNAEKVNSPFWWHFATTERCKLYCGSRCDIWFHQLTSDH